MYQVLRARSKGKTSFFKTIFEKKIFLLSRLLRDVKSSSREKELATVTVEASSSGSLDDLFVRSHVNSLFIVITIIIIIIIIIYIQ